MNSEKIVEAIYYTSSLEKKMLKSKDEFLDLYNSFDKKQEQACLESCKDQSMIDILGPLLRDGVVKVEDMFSEEDLKGIREFADYLSVAVRVSQDKAIHHYGPEHESIAGYFTPSGSLKHLLEINFNLWLEHWMEAIHLDDDPDNVCFSSSKDPQDGQLRMQSKSWKGHLPGVGQMAKNTLLCNLFAHYNNLPQVVIDNSNLEWILPAKKNHNGWHRDCVTHQLKAMVLVDDVDEYSAPLLYALKSHRTTTEFDKQHLYDRFCLSGECKHDNPHMWEHIRSEWPKYARKKKGSHCGYLSDESAPNDILPENRVASQIEIGGSQYEMFVGTGKAGDVIIFDSCGLHSGSRAHTNMRRNITFSSLKNLSLKRRFFNGIRKFS